MKNNYNNEGGKSRFHPTQKSFRLFDELVEKHSSENDVEINNDNSNNEVGKGVEGAYVLDANILNYDNIIKNIIKSSLLSSIISDRNYNNSSTNEAPHS